MVNETARASRGLDARKRRCLAAFRATVLGLALASTAGICTAQQSAPLRLKRSAEIAPFRLTSIEGYVTARYLRDDSSSSSKGTNSRQTLSTLGEELSIMTHSYIFHPGLISLDVGGGPILDRSRYGGDGIAMRQGRQVYNLSGRATILRDKPYTGAIFYDLRNQTQQMGPAQVMLTENEHSGFEFALLSPVTPAPIRVDATRTTNQGKGTDQIADDRIDRLRLRVDANLGTLGTTAVQYQGTQQASRSGSPGLPIQASTTNTTLVNLDTRLKLGADQQYDLLNYIAINNNRYAFGRGGGLAYNDTRFSLDLRGRHTGTLHSASRIDLNTSKQGAQSIGVNALRSSLTYRPSDDISATLGARGEQNKTGASVANLRGLDGTAQYRHALPLGEGRAGYGFNYLQRDQQESAQQAQTIGEAVNLSGTTFVPLARELIVAGSVTVSNLTRTQTYVEGIDYLLTMVGLTTRIQRTPGSSILDGQDVLVDYAYAFGGSYAMKQLDQNVNFSWVIGSYLNSYLRFVDSKPQITSGTPTAPVNPSNSTVFGTRGEFPFDWWLYTRLGGYAESEHRREVISPYQRGSLEAYATVAMPWVRSGDLRLGARRTRIAYNLNPQQGVDLTGIDLGLSAILPLNVNVSLNATRERDTGTPLARERAFLAARAKWRVRKLQLSFELTRTHDAQGESQRSRTYAQFLLRRDF